MWAGVWGEETLHAGSLFAALMDGSLHLLRFVVAYIPVRISNFEGDRVGWGIGGSSGSFSEVVDSVALQLCVLLSITEVFAEPSEGQGDYVGGDGGAGSARSGQLGVCGFVENGSGGNCGGMRYFLVGSADWADGL